MNSTVKYILVLSFYLFTDLVMIAQYQEPCGQAILTNEWFKKHPELQDNYNSFVEKLQRNVKAKGNSNSNRNIKYTIPIVFHILHQEGPENISDAQIFDQLKILNRDYQKKNADTSLIVNAFKNNIANVGFEFKLASIDPDGNCTKGIIRHVTDKTVWDAYDLTYFTYSWPANKYLNVYVVKNINAAPAYTFLPGVGIPPSADAIVCQADHIGSIGISNLAKSRALTHEVGHWFGLPHIWGVTNVPGVVCGDDFVDDTPITKGFITCSTNNSKICNPNIEENLQNYMDYAPCKIMFTNGQADYMIETITMKLNNRDELVSEQNLIATGIIGNLDCEVKAAIAATYYTACVNEEFNFIDDTYKKDKDVKRKWVFKGGNPEISTDSSVIVIYNNAGNYEVKLYIESQSKIDSTTKQVFIYDSNKSEKPSIYYAFDVQNSTGSLEFSTNSEEVKWEVFTESGANNSNGCLSLQNYLSSFNIKNTTYFETPFLDFSNIIKPQFSFYYAYAKYSENQKDTFYIEYTLDCGKTWLKLPSIPGTQFMAKNSGGVKQEFYKPAPSDWKKVTMLSVFTGLFKNKENVKFRFSFKVDKNAIGYNNFFIDEINILDAAPTSVKNEVFDNIIIYPNPASSIFHISLPEELPKILEISVLDLTGKIVNVDMNWQENKGIGTVTLNTENQLQSGVYNVNIKLDSYTINKKVVVF